MGRKFEIYRVTPIGKEASAPRWAKMRFLACPNSDVPAVMRETKELFSHLYTESRPLVVEVTEERELERFVEMTREMGFEIREVRDTGGGEGGK